jgi:arylsulfatase A-like enzyme
VRSSPAALPPEVWDPPPPVASRPKPPEGAPNVVVVITCTMRRDQLTPYGGPPNTSPYLARLASEGARFDDLIAGSAWTKESSTAILTGHMAIDVGMTDPGDALGRRRLSTQVTTLAERLVAAGWWAAGVTANPHVDAEFGFAQGMDRYQGTVEAGFAKTNKRSADDVVKSALSFLRDRRPDERDRPFYLQLVVIDPHYPRDPLPGEIDSFLADDVPVRLAAYRAMVRRVDDALSELDQGLSDLGYDADNTVLAVLADHGEGLDMPPHHRSQHGRVLYRSLTQVGWIVRGPGIPANELVSGLASHLDVVPTLLGLSGLPTNPPSDELQAGYDWSGILREGGRTIRHRAVSDTWYEGANRAAIWTSERECQRDWGSKVNNDSFQSTCFDRVADPDFTVPLDDDALMRELVAWRTGAQERYRAFPDTGDAPTLSSIDDQLQALGYAQ